MYLNSGENDGDLDSNLIIFLKDTKPDPNPMVPIIGNRFQSRGQNDTNPN